MESGIANSCSILCCTDCCSQVVETTATDVICEARNDAVLGGLLTVFHTERATSGVTNVQNELPVRTEAHACSTAVDWWTAIVHRD